MTSFFSVNLQIILVIIATGVIISVTDNILDSQRLSEVSQRGRAEREANFNQTLAEQQQIQMVQQRHNNQTEQTLQELTAFITRELARDENVTAPLIAEFGKLVNTTEKTFEAFDKHANQSAVTSVQQDNNRILRLLAAELGIPVNSTTSSSPPPFSSRTSNTNG